MSLPRRITALLTAMTPNQVAAMPPAERQRLANECERVMRMIGPEPPKSGVLASLRNGERAL